VLTVWITGDLLHDVLNRLIGPAAASSGQPWRTP